jgi:hypothetical protein
LRSLAAFYTAAAIGTPRLEMWQQKCGYGKEALFQVAGSVLGSCKVVAEYHASV